MPIPLPRPRPRRLFLWLWMATLAGSVLGTRWHITQGWPVPEWPLAVDLLIVVPLAYLILCRPPWKTAALGAAGLVSLGVLAGAWLIPESSKSLWLWLEPARWGVVVMLLGWQAAGLWQVARALRRCPPGRALEQALHDAMDTRFGAGPLTDVLKLEARLWLYALCRPASRLRFLGPGHFHTWRQGQNASNQLGFLILVAVELPVAHLLLHLFSPMLAWAVSAATLYGWLFLWAEYRATLYRPITLSEYGLHIGSGLVTDVCVPCAALLCAEPIHHRPRRARHRLRLTGMGQANVLLRLAPGTTLWMPWGAREVTEVVLGVDEPAAFIAAVGSTAPVTGPGLVPAHTRGRASCTP